MGLPSTSRLFFRFVSPPRSTLLAAQELYGSISPRVLMAAGSSSVSLNGLRSSRGVSFAILVSIVRSWLLEVNSRRGGAAATVTDCCRAPGSQRRVHG